MRPPRQTVRTTDSEGLTKRMRKTLGASRTMCTFHSAYMQQHLGRGGGGVMQRWRVSWKYSVYARVGGGGMTIEVGG